MEQVKCPICGKPRDNEQFTDCPYCGWSYTSWENLYEPDEKDEFNLMSANQARKLFKEGKTVYGKPLPYKKS